MLFFFLVTLGFRRLRAFAGAAGLLKVASANAGGRAEFATLPASLMESVKAGCREVAMRFCGHLQTQTSEQRFADNPPTRSTRFSLFSHFAGPSISTILAQNISERGLSQCP